MLLRWCIGIVLLMAGGFPVLLALWGWASAPQDASEPVSGYLLLGGLGLPAISLGGYLVVSAIRAESARRG